ncbi:site-2 protease family protein [Desulforhopalus singaporensis]|uniref:Zn-dependent protease (Includes SpoIVFB) n=1 Tax=Desulforhopalus singaporensis TaxID=91360 RepID=A0A1H0MJZ6_9BACT|nr:site-2 protease family protein [Desulforhopalus singaporensis]SDO80470.1 Zn-dependent protease (includes SpoIVFB) [Desulforhopalus singaporensis]
MAKEFYLPYLIKYCPAVPEEMVIMGVAMLTAVMVSAEGQGFVATLLGDAVAGKKDRLHFNVFLHLSLLGTINFFVAGFGWPKEVRIDKENFKVYPRLFLFLSRCAGPVANLLMANIAASIVWILGRWGVEDQVFSAIVVVNVTMALYGLLIIPPLPGFGLVAALLPEKVMKTRGMQLLQSGGPFLVVISFLLIRISGYQGVGAFFNPVVRAVTDFMLHI